MTAGGGVQGCRHSPAINGPAAARHHPRASLCSRTSDAVSRTPSVTGCVQSSVILIEAFLAPFCKQTATQSRRHRGAQQPTHPQSAVSPRLCPSQWAPPRPQHHAGVHNTQKRYTWSQAARLAGQYGSSGTHRSALCDLGRHVESTATVNPYHTLPSCWAISVPFPWPHHCCRCSICRAGAPSFVDLASDRCCDMTRR